MNFRWYILHDGQIEHDNALPNKKNTIQLDQDDESESIFLKTTPRRSRRIDNMLCDISNHTRDENNKGSAHYIIENLTHNTGKSHTKLFKKYQPLGNKISSIISQKPVSQDTGTNIMGLLIDFVEENSAQTILQTLSPDKTVITQNKSANNKLIRDLLESIVDVNNHQKGRGTIKKRK